MKRVILLLTLMVALSVNIFAQQSLHTEESDFIRARTEHSWEIFEQERANIISSFSNWYVESYATREYTGRSETTARDGWGCVCLIDTFGGTTKEYILVRYKTDTQLKDILKTEKKATLEVLQAYRIR
jgi:hypothetical protein